MGKTGGIAALVAAAGLAAAPALAAERAAAPTHRSSHAGHGAASGAIINLGLIAAIGVGVLIATAGGKGDAADSN